MPRATTLIHPGLFENLQPHFYRNICEIQSRTDVQNEIGELASEADNPFTTLEGHEAIICNLAADSSKQTDEAEIRTGSSTYVADFRQCSLDGLYPAITNTMKAVVDGVEYNIRNVVHASHGEQTKLVLEVIT